MLVSVGAFAANDISNCFDANMEQYANQLTQQGYSLVGTTSYEVVYYAFGSSKYWKTVNAKKMKGPQGQLAFATCQGVVGNLSPQVQTLKGTWSYCRHMSYDPNECVSWSLDHLSGSAEFVFQIDDIYLNHLGGGLQIKAKGFYQNIQMGNMTCHYASDFDFHRVCESFNQNAMAQVDVPYTSSLTIGRTQVGMTNGLTTGARFNLIDNMKGLIVNFATAQPVAAPFALHVVDLAGNTGIDILPKKSIVLNVDFNSQLTIQNDSAFAVELSSPIMAPTFLKAKQGHVVDQVTFPVTSPGFITVRSGAFEQAIEIKSK